jgi:Resolvase, N terminal domain
MAIYGYARVSTGGQSLASQDAQLRAAGCTKTYAEKVSGAWSDRPQLAKLLKRLDQGDVLIVTRLDRLARSTRDLLNILDAVGKAGAAFKSLGDVWADTTTPHGRLMHADGAWGTRRVRARANHCPHGRGPNTSKGPWREIRATGSSNAASTAGSHAEARAWRGASRCGSELQRIASNNQPVGGAQPFRGKRGRRVRKRDR